MGRQHSAVVQVFVLQRKVVASERYSVGEQTVALHIAFVRQHSVEVQMPVAHKVEVATAKYSVVGEQTLAEHVSLA